MSLVSDIKIKQAWHSIIMTLMSSSQVSVYISDELYYVGDCVLPEHLSPCVLGLELAT